MEILNFYEKSRTALAHLDKNETEAAYKVIKKLLTAFQGKALIWYLMGRYYEQKKDIFHSIDSYTRALHTDPAFLSAAEKLLQLNKDNYSVGELKYLYSLITVYKKGSEEMYQFLQKFKNTPINADLTVPDLDQDRLSADELPGMDDDAYIQHLIRGMDKIEEDRAKKTAQEPPEKKDIPSEKKDQAGTGIPEDFQPPPKQAPPPNNNEKLSRLSSYGIETMTMAQMYIRQGLYENAMEILLKLQKRNPSSERIENEISRVRELIAQENKEKNE